MKNVFPQKIIPKQSERAVLWLQKKGSKEGLIQPYDVFDSCFLSLYFCFMIRHRCRIYKITIFCKGGIFFWIPKLPLSPQRFALEVAWLLHIEGNKNYLVLFFSFVKYHEDYFSLYQKALPGKKVPFSVKSVVCISRYSSAVKLLNSSQLFSNQPSLHLLAGWHFLVWPIGCFTLEMSYDLASNLHHWYFLIIYWLQIRRLSMYMTKL